MSTAINTIGVLTSGGDSPGMNAAIRAVVRSALTKGLNVRGIIAGYKGMIEGDFIELQSRSVSNIIQRGGTILKSARCKEFHTQEGRSKAFNQLKENSIDALIVIGGDGSFTGAQIFSQEYNIPVVGIPGTIDNDITGTDFTIGFDTALNTIVEAVDKIRDTAASHDRLFFIEVMGRDSGYLALTAGVACGAEAIILPEVETDIQELIRILQAGAVKSKSSSIVIVGEGDKEKGKAFRIAQEIQTGFPYFETKVTVLGHIQRGGSPTAADRILASKLGSYAVQALLDGHSSVMAGIINNEVTLTSFKKAIKQHAPLDKYLLGIHPILST